MNNVIKTFSNFLGRYLAIIFVTMVAVGYLFPWNNIPHAILIMVVMMAFISFTSGIGIDLSAFVTQIKKPFLSCYLIMLVHLACPLVAWVLGLIFYSGDMNVRIGFLISACVPMASSSLVWAAMSGGSVSLTILTLSIEALVAPAVIPLSLWVVLGKTIAFNYGSMIPQLLCMVTIPSLMGMLIHKYAGEEKINKIADYLNAVSKLLMIAMVYINCSKSFQGFVIDRGLLKLLSVILLFVICNYFVGYLGMSILKNRATLQERIAAFFCCGMRNNSFALVIAITYFNPAAGIPLALSVIIQQPFAGIMHNFLINKKRNTVIE